MALLKTRINKENKPYFIILAAIAVLGFILRILNLDVVTLWVDEYVHVLRAQEVVNGSGPLFKKDNGGILLTMIIIPLFKLFGETAFWARFPSVVFGTLSIPLIFLLAKKLFNKNVAVIAAFLGAFSLYLIFWSRMSRNYAVFEFFYLLLLTVFIYGFEHFKKPFKQPEFANNLRLNFKLILALPLILILSVISHNLSLFFLFSAGMFFLLMAVFKRVKPSIGDAAPKLYTIFGAVFLVVSIFLFIPGLSGVFKAPLSLFLPPDYVDWFVPDWSKLGEAWEQKPYESFDRYFDVLKYDLKYFYIFGILGFISALFINLRSGIFLLSFFVWPFILMSFVFREPYLPRYLIYIYPLFLISGAALVYYMFRWLNNFFFKNKSVKFKTAGSFILTAILILPIIRAGEIQSLVGAEKHSKFLVDSKLSRWSFTNWVEPYRALENVIQEDDAVLSTIPGSAKFYLKRDDVGWFRQRKYSPKEKGYVLNEYDDSGEANGRTLQNLKETMREYSKGWLFADYYLFGPLTDPQARNHVFQNMKYEFDASSNGDVYVFSWDHSENVTPMATVEHLGPNKTISQALRINLPDISNYPHVDFYIDCQGIDFNQEAVVIFNGSYSQFIPPPKSEGRGFTGVRVSTQNLKSGENTVQFKYQPGEQKHANDERTGFVIYNLRVGG